MYKKDIDTSFFKTYRIRLIFSVVFVIIIIGFITAFMALQWENSEALERVQITTDMGPMKGVIKTSYYNRQYASFSGIPFAVPPIGELRFKSPVPALPWDGLLDATEPKDPCVQPSYYSDETIGKEDCLYLNVYTPDLSGKLPVLVYIHGGSYRQGSLNEGAETRVDDNVVVVSIAYRLGIFGFLSLNTSTVPGNAGLRDQIMALQWVKDNVKVFGGNPENVTILGLSAGAASVSHLQVSPLARGLFHRVMAMSGTSLCDWAIQKSPEKMVKKLATILKIDTTENIEEALMNMPAHELSVESLKVEADPGGFYEDLIFVPVVETIFPDFESVFYKNPIEYVKNLEFSDVPLIIGYTSKEYVWLYEPETIKSYVDDDRVIVPDRWRLEATDAEVETLARLIRLQYFNAESFNPNNREMLLDGVELLGDIMFNQPIIESAKTFAQYSTNPVYLYRFSYRGVFNNPKIEDLGIQGAAHADDIEYLFTSIRLNVSEYSATGWVRRRFVKFISNFVESGNPTPGPEDALLPSIWERITPDSFNYMDINGDVIPSKNPDEYKTQFWTELEKKWRNGEL